MRTTIALSLKGVESSEGSKGSKEGNSGKQGSEGSNEGDEGGREGSKEGGKEVGKGSECGKGSEGGKDGSKEGGKQGSKGGKEGSKVGMEGVEEDSEGTKRASKVVRLLERGRGCSESPHRDMGTTPEGGRVRCSIGSEPKAAEEGTYMHVMQLGEDTYRRCDDAVPQTGATRPLSSRSPTRAGDWASELDKAQARSLA